MYVGVVWKVRRVGKTSRTGFERIGSELVEIDGVDEVEAEDASFWADLAAKCVFRRADWRESEVLYGIGFGRWRCRRCMTWL